MFEVDDVFEFDLTSGPKYCARDANRENIYEDNEIDFTHLCFFIVFDRLKIDFVSGLTWESGRWLH